MLTRRVTAKQLKQSSRTKDASMCAIQPEEDRQTPSKTRPPAVGIPMGLHFYSILPALPNKTPYGAIVRTTYMRPHFFID